MPDSLNPGVSRPPNSGADERNWLPWVIAAAVVIAAVAILAVLGSRHGDAPQANHAGLSPLDAYAPRLVIADVKMSEAGNFAGSKVTYVEGRITNNGDKTLTNITVEVAFRNAFGEIAQKESLPMMLIRTREPYVDTEAVQAAPIKPGTGADFRLVFDHMADDWNQQYPEIRVIGVEGH